MSNHFLDYRQYAQESDFAPFLGDSSQSKKVSEIKPPVFEKAKKNREKSKLDTLDLKLTTVVSSFEQKGLRQMWAHGQIAKIKGRKKVKPKMPADHYALLRSGLSFSSVLTTVYLG